MSRLVGVMLVQQIKSSKWPLLWLGRFTCCVIKISGPKRADVCVASVLTLLKVSSRAYMDVPRSF